MSIKDGIKHYVDAALDTKDDIAAKMMDAGVDPKQALLASSVVTKEVVREKLDSELSNKNAAEITSTVSNKNKTTYIQ